MNKDLLRVSLRQRALYVNVQQADEDSVSPAGESMALALCSELRQLGYTVSESLLRALSRLSAADLSDVSEVLNDVLGTQLNWASLVRGWQVPTGESYADHFLTMLANMEGVPASQLPGTTLPCGHFIPDGTFPLERYTGCPFCGRPFVTVAGQVYRGQGSRLKVLQLWDDADLDRHFADLMASPVPLDATQRASLSVLLRERPLPAVVPTMKETCMLVVDALVALGRDADAGRLMTSPQDIMRYLWYRHTGHLQLLEPRTLLKTHAKNQRHELHTPDDLDRLTAEKKKALRLKYSRDWCRRVAGWLNALDMPLPQQLETIHPKRRLWVRFIRGLRLTEYARRPGYGQLRQLLDLFYRQDYRVWSGELQSALLQGKGLELLQQRPGVFARRLFSVMLRIGAAPVLDAFRGVAGQVAPRLLLTLGSQAQLYFDPTRQRVARPLSGLLKDIGPNPLLARYTGEQLMQMQHDVMSIYLDVMRRRFAQQAEPAASRTIFIDPRLDDIPVAIGDRSATIQDTSAALQGTRFAVEGDAVRLFLQWGKGLPAQQLDMDLSCHLLKDGDAEVCSYFSLNVPGAKHSGDIRQIPDQVGTAEYIELSLPELQAAGVRQAVFTCNAYTAGELQPNLVVGWMSAAQPMTVSNETGVAYDPSTVDHMVRIAESNLSKGLIFGVLDVACREITWLEMPFDGQTVLNINTDTIGTLLSRLRAKPTIGQLLRMKAEVQQLKLTDRPEEADEQYTYQWALDTAAVSRLLLDNL